MSLIIRRTDGSGLAFDSATDTFDQAGFTSGIPGHTGRAYALLDHTSTSVSVSATYVTWDSDDHSDYLAGGYWMHLTGTSEPLQITGGLKIGAFADGPELSGTPTLPGVGTASYRGPSGGPLREHLRFRHIRSWKLGSG